MDLEFTEYLAVCLNFQFFLQIQQVMDSFIIYVSQQKMANSTTKGLGLPEQSGSIRSGLTIPWTQFSPSNINIVPFPTREYTDDEFQSIIKKVMGVLYVASDLLPFLQYFFQNFH